MSFEELLEKFSPMHDLVDEARAAVRTLPNCDYRQWLTCSVRFNTTISDAASHFKIPLRPLREAALTGLVEIYKREASRQ